MTHLREPLYPHTWLFVTTIVSAFLGGVFASGPLGAGAVLPTSGCLIVSLVVLILVVACLAGTSHLSYVRRLERHFHQKMSDIHLATIEALKVEMDAKDRPSEVAVHVPERGPAAHQPEPSSRQGVTGLIQEPSSPATNVFDDIARAHREIYALDEIAQAMGGTLAVRDTMALITSKLASIVPISCCALFLFEEDAGVLRCEFAHGMDAERLQQLTIRYGQGLVGWVARNRRPLVNARPSADFEAAGLATQTSLEAALVCPLVCNGRFLGSLAVYHTAAGTFTDDHRRLLDRVSEQAAAVIYNSLAFEQTKEESLTELEGSLSPFRPARRA